MCGAYVTGAVGLEEVLVAGGFVGHVLFDISILTEVCGWCASEPVGFVAAPAAGEGRDVVLRLQVHTEQRITIVIERQVSVLFRFRQRVFAKLLRGWEPQQRRFHFSLGEQLRKPGFWCCFVGHVSCISTTFNPRGFSLIASTYVFFRRLQWKQSTGTAFVRIWYADLISWIVVLVLRVCAVLIFEIESER